jgi:hypothetical protein
MSASVQDVREPASTRTRARDVAARVSETAVARVALGVVALHIADDSFFQPQPGTSASDHLISGLVPIGVLGLAAWAYPKLRPGLRAILALFFGIFGIITGVEAVYYTTKGGPSGDDFTGLLALLAGIVLLGVGAVTLWRSRKTTGSRVWRYTRRVLLAVGGLAVVYLVVFPLSLSYIFTHVARGFVPTAELGTAYEDVSFATSDGLELEGWYIPSQNRAAVIAFPGRSGPQRPARMLARRGYGVLLFDRRGEGESEGNPNVFGWRGARDVRAAVEYRRDDDRGGRGLGRPRRARVGRGGNPLHSRGPRDPGHAEADRSHYRARDRHTRDRDLLEQPAALESRGPLGADRSYAGALHLRRARVGRRGRAHPDVLRSGGRAEGCLARPGRRTHRGHRGAAG